MTLVCDIKESQEFIPLLYLILSWQLNDKGIKNNSHFYIIDKGTDEVL